MRSRALRIALLSLLAVSPALAQSMNLPQDNRMKMLSYDESDVYTIVTKCGYQTNIVFGPGEEIQTISVGDRSPWQLIPSGNRLFVRPLVEDVTTNMTILTNKHSYQFDLKSLGAEKKGDAIYVARFIYPDKMPDPLPMMMEPPVSLTPPAAPPMATPLPAVRPLTEAPREKFTPQSGPGISRPVYPNYNYSYSGPDALAPLQVYDDGKATYIRYPDTSRIMPNIYRIESGGEETPVTYTTQGETLVVNAIANQWALKDNNGTVRVYNEMLNPR